MAVIAYFLDKDLKNQSILIGIRKIKGSHNGENTAKAIIPILIKMNIINKLGYFITNNVTTNNLIIKIILQRLRLDITYLGERRVRCLRHIINLAAKAFLFSNNKESFENVQFVSQLPITALEAEIDF
jgi:hypothetical protein